MDSYRDSKFSPPATSTSRSQAWPPYGETSPSKTFKPVSFNSSRTFASSANPTSPSSTGLHNTPMTITVNSQKGLSEYGPPVATGPQYQSTMKITMSPQSSERRGYQTAADKTRSQHGRFDSVSPSVWSPAKVAPGPKTKPLPKAMPKPIPKPVSSFGVPNQRAPSGRPTAKQSKGMDLFLRQQEKLIQLGADVKVSNGTSEPHSNPPSQTLTSLAETILEKPPERQVNGPHPRLGSSVSAPKPGVWSPGMQPSKLKSEVEQKQTKPEKSETSLKDIAPIWTPGGSPGGVRKEFKPVKLDTTAKSTFKTKQGVPQHFKPEESYAWRSDDFSMDDTKPLPTSSFAYTPLSRQSDTVTPGSAPSISTADSSRINGSINSSNIFTDSRDDQRDDLRLPPTQSPYITLLQKGREGRLPKGAVYIGKKESIEGDQKHTDSYYAVPTEEKTTTTKVIEQKPKRYEGIGPLDQEGVPLAFRKNIDEKNQHAWYKQMYKSLHKTEKKEDLLGINELIDSIFEEADENTYKPTYTFPDDISDTKSEEAKKTNVPESTSNNIDSYRPSSDTSSRLKDESGYRSEPEGRYKDLYKGRNRSMSERNEPRRHFWTPAHARASIEVYRNQPRSIMDYEPGFSSIALREAKTGIVHNPPIDKPGQFSNYSVGRKRQTSVPDLSRDDEVDQKEPTDIYKQVQQGGEIPYKGLQKPAPEKPKTFRHQTTDVRRAAPVTEKERRRRQEEEAYRKRRLEELYEEERRRKILQEEASNEARKHSDFFTPSQKSPIPLNRFDEQPAQGGLSVPPERRRGFQIQGKARALYNFNAQNPRELCLRKGDVVYLLRQIDKNWMEGERHGRVGIFPVNYVEVVTSIEAAKVAAMQAEGQGRAKYNFTAQSNVELSLRKGEFVVLLRRIDENWFEGKIGNRQGIFPVAYIDVIREPSTPMVTPAPSVITTPMTGTPEMLSPVSGYDAPTPPPQPSPSAFMQRSPTTAYGYRQSSPGGPRSHSSQLSPQLESDHRPFSHRPQQSPTFVRKQVSPTSTMSHPGYGTTPPEPHPLNDHDFNLKSKVPDDDLAVTRYRAVYAYKPLNEDELELNEGDEVYVMEKCDDGWYVGTSGKTGQFGTFPGNYVQPI